jgi:hypothetical protein
VSAIDDKMLAQIEERLAAGVTSADILDVMATHDIPFSEATLRKYVQLGLLPRSVRVGRKGKHQGSQGIYPVHVIRQILSIKQMMAASHTIGQIKREFLFMRSELTQLEQTLDGILSKLDRVIKERKGDPMARRAAHEVGEARALSRDLVGRFRAIEAQLTARARIERVAAS